MSFRSVFCREIPEAEVIQARLLDATGQVDKQEASLGIDRGVKATMPGISRSRLRSLEMT